MKTLQHAIAGPGLVLLVASACGNSSGGVSETGSGGNAQCGTTSGSGATGGTGGSATGGNSTGGTNAGMGGATAGQGGSAGSSGGSAGTAGGVGGSAGATGGDGGMTTGGTSGGGMGGSGGGGPTGEVGTLGENCSPTGALACNGNNQKLTLVCGGSGTWEVNQTCEATEFCDSMAGPNAGLCATPDAECAARMANQAFCIGQTASACDADGLRVLTVQECLGACEDGGCDDDRDPCPTGEFTNCDPECGAVYSRCNDFDQCDYVDALGDASAAIRIGPLANACDPSCVPWKAWKMTVLASVTAADRYRVRVRKPWTVVEGDFISMTDPEPLCDLPAGTNCIISEPGVNVQRNFFVSTSDASAEPRNLTFELVNGDATCP